ncbi:beta-xylosidase [Pseudovirgaria hyperparasitica]|uniref:xylan 1,4-beta-xylosidase n=1 Tax=Pseudovirgaria hyperparasitica TaxID=470096 RepID=A0A6A6VZU6_9PEZI|nr:beta-xylosidase [Pseudovirgaria hyperparasitica]KAF2756172.1 beta-xylosidase [Pseudovirgaria hyperparasitica]
MYPYALLALFLTGIANAAFPDCAKGPLANNTICDASADTRTRALSLISLMSINEKIDQTGNTALGLSRLGLPKYQWWNEALHGVAKSLGVKFNTAGEFSHATSFPQPILIGAAFDDALIKAVATVVSTEARAFSNANLAGLDYWTPNINPFKDPRWGRGQETPGEDPFHLSSYVKNLIAGLQGDGEYRKVVATCKHWAGYDLEDWAGNSRKGFDAVIGMQDLSEYYSPPFQTCARDEDVGSVMCSYNAVNGVPTCADPYILQTILRDHWNWTSEDNLVVSDCDAVLNVFSPHNYTSTLEEAVASSLLAGTDINCGSSYQRYLLSAHTQGLYNESALDKALVRAYSTLIRLGYFDPPAAQPYRNLAWSDVNTPAAQNLAYTAAVKGITLLKNDNRILPLTLTPNTSIALIGNWANATTQMQGNYYGVAPYLTSPLAAAQALGISIKYAQGPTASDPATGTWPDIWAAADAASVLIVVAGIDNSNEAESRDRDVITWGAGQTSVIKRLAGYGKPMVVVQMGGGQVDSSFIRDDERIGALLWAGYPGQDGGRAVMDVLTGKAAPAGRLPVTQYPGGYVDEVKMTDMRLRPGEGSPGRTYRWYEGEAVYPFGSGLHYTTFDVSVEEGEQALSFDIAELVDGCTEKHLDLCPLASVPVAVTNSGKEVTSDFVVLGFGVGSNGPAPYPKKSLIAYERLLGIAPGKTKTAHLNLTLNSLSRVLENGDRVLFPGTYQLQVDNQPLTTLKLTLTGSELLLDAWPQPPASAVTRQHDDFLSSGA